VARSLVPADPGLLDRWLRRRTGQQVPRPDRRTARCQHVRRAALVARSHKQLGRSTVAPRPVCANGAAYPYALLLPLCCCTPLTAVVRYESFERLAAGRVLYTPPSPPSTRRLGLSRSRALRYHAQPDTQPTHRRTQILRATYGGCVDAASSLLTSISLLRRARLMIESESLPSRTRDSRSVNACGMQGDRRE